MQVTSTVQTVGVLFVALCTAVGCCSHPHDDVLIRQFQDSHERLQALARMVLEDSDRLPWLTLRPGTTVPDLVPDRNTHYAELMKELGLSEIRSGGPGRVVLVVSKCGFAHFTSEIKGYYYYEGQLQNIVSDLDIYKANHTRRKSMQPAYRRIGEHWYLYFRFQ